MKLTFKQLTIYLCLLSIGSGVGFLSSRYREKRNIINSEMPKMPLLRRSPPPQASINTQNDRYRSDNLNFIATAANKVGPAVVRIDSARSSSNIPESYKDPFFKKFFGDNTPIPPQDRMERGTGSGFILSEDGRILTNAHVVAGSDTVKVTLKDGRVFSGRVIGTDRMTDVAVVKIDASDLPTVQLGSSENLTPGQWAIAIGNPLGLDNTVTVGIISATGRSSSQVGVPDKRVRFIQTDAAINPGNSGGPLLNDQGEVIGINTAIRADAQGLGFAIPIETAEKIANQLFAKGKVEHPFLGIQMVTITPDLPDKINQDRDLNFKITQDQGVLIVRIINNSPAERSGLRQGDVIQKIDGLPVTSASEVQERVEASAIGALLNLEINRNGQTQIIQIRTGAFPNQAVN